MYSLEHEIDRAAHGLCHNGGQCHIEGSTKILQLSGFKNGIEGIKHRIDVLGAFGAISVQTVVCQFKQALALFRESLFIEANVLSKGVGIKCLEGRPTCWRHAGQQVPEDATEGENVSVPCHVFTQRYLRCHEGVGARRLSKWVEAAITPHESGMCQPDMVEFIKEDILRREASMAELEFASVQGLQASQDPLRDLEDARCAHGFASVKRLC